MPNVKNMTALALLCGWHVKQATVSQYCSERKGDMTSSVMERHLRKLNYWGVLPGALHVNERDDPTRRVGTSVFWSNLVPRLESYGVIWSYAESAQLALWGVPY